MFSELDKSNKVGLPRGSRDLGGRYALLRARDCRSKIQEGHIANIIKAFLSEQGFTDDYVQVTRWAKLLLPNGQIVRSAWKEEQKSLKDIHTAHFVKVKI